MRNRRRRVMAVAIITTLAPVLGVAQTLTGSHVYLGATAVEVGERHTMHVTISNPGTQDLSNLVLAPAPMAAVVPYDINTIEVPSLHAGSSVEINWSITLPSAAELVELSSTLGFSGTAQLSDGTVATVSLESMPNVAQP